MNNYFLNNNIVDHLDYRTGRSLNYPINEDQAEIRKHSFSLEKHKPKEYYEDDYLITNNITSPILIDGPEVLYKINRAGFRSKHFEDFNPNNVNILYGGCSWTFGEGLPEELTWTHMLSDKIKTLHPDKQVDSYNVAISGASIDLIIKNVVGFLNNFGQPDYIILNFPDIYRKLRYNHQTSWYGEDPLNLPEGFVKAFRGTYYMTHRKDNPSRIWTEHGIYENIVNDHILNIHLLEYLCAAAKIKLLWTNWTYDPTLMNTNFKNSYFLHGGPFYKSSREDIEVPYPNDANLPYWSIAKDDAHPGTAYTTKLAEGVFGVLSSSH